MDYEPKTGTIVIYIGDNPRFAKQWAEHAIDGYGVVEHSVLDMPETWISVTFSDGYNNNYPLRELGLDQSDTMPDPEFSLEEIETGKELMYDQERAL